jgi:hypothetical protein
MSKPNNGSEIVGFRCALPNLLVAKMMIKAKLQSLKFKKSAAEAWAKSM